MNSRAHALVAVWTSALMSLTASANAAPPAPPSLSRRPTRPPQPPPVVMIDPAAAALATTWAYAHGGNKEDTAGAIRQTASSGLVLAGDTESVGAGKSDLWLKVVDSAGVKVWEKAYGLAGNDLGGVSPLSGGSYLLEATSYDAGTNQALSFTFGKLNSDGTFAWQKKLQKAGADTTDLSGVMSLAGGGFLLTGYVIDISVDPPAFRTVFIKTDSAGVIQWQKEFLGAELAFIAPVELPDGTLIAAGSADPDDSDEDYGDGRIRELSSAGAVLWDKYYRGSDFEGLYQVVAANGGGYLAVGATSSFPGGGQDNSDIWLVKLDTNGNITAQRAIGGAANDFAGVSVLSDGYLLSGTTLSTGNPTGDFFVMKLDNNLNKVWAKTYRTTAGSIEFAFAFPDTSVAGFLVGGSTDAAGRGLDALGAKLDANGNPVWARAYGGNGEDLGFFFRAGALAAAAAPVDAAAAASDLVLSGYTESWGSGGKDALVAVLDSNGQLASCPLVQTITMTATDWAVTTTTTTATTSNATTTVNSPAYSTANGTLTATNVSTTATDTCTAAQLYSAAASASVHYGDAPLTVNFTGVATGGTGPYTYSWSFGDGTADSSQQNPSHTYNNGGEFHVTLTVTDATTATATDDHLYIEVAGEGAVCTLSCSATVPASAPPGEQVQFSSTFNAPGCQGAPVIGWDFGDGQSVFSQNPTHAYTTAGTYTWTLYVYAGIEICIKSGTINVRSAAACTVDATPVVPATGGAGSPVSFLGYYNGTAGCEGLPTAFAWTFGDGQSSTQQNPSHTYSAAGTYNWTFTVTRGTASDSANGSITISASPQYTYWIPSAAHAPGAQGSKWRSDVAVVNRSGSTANLALLFIPYSSGASVPRDHTLANNNTVLWTDVLVSLFTFADSANTKGTVRITSNVPIVAMERTYNQAATGTFGQYYPALTTAQGITGSQAAVLPLLKKNATFRTNGGFQNLGGASCTGEIKLFSAAGAQVGTTRTLTAAADKYIQEDDIFTKAGAGNQEVAYARVQATTSGCTAWFFGSVIDGSTNDPTTVPQQLSAAGPYWIPSAAHAPGLSGSKWRADVSVVNRSGGTANLTLEFIPYSSGATVTRPYALADNNAVEWKDVLVSLFGFADSANTKGTIKITSDRSIFALSRTYNQAATGTFGQYYPSLTAATSITNGQTAILPLLQKSATFRTNGGFQNVGSGSCTGTIKLFNAAGAQVGTTRTLSAAVDKYIQEDDIFTKAGAGNQQPAYAVVEVTTPGGKAWFFGSVIDGNTNDPTTVPQQGP